MTTVHLAARRCPVCGSTDDSSVIAEATFDRDAWTIISFSSRKLPEFIHHRVVCCPTCDLAYASPAPDATAVLEAYEAAPFVSTAESRYAAETYVGLVARHVLPRLPRRGSALDIGASDGAFMEALLGVGFEDVWGVEPSSASIASASECVRSRILPGAFTGELFPDRKFDLVTILQTLEHLDDPVEVVRDARQMLSEVGAVLIVVHDRRAWPARVFGSRSPIYDVEHLQLFSRRSIVALLERAGLVDIEIHPVRNRYPLAYWTRIAPVRLRLKRPFLRLIEGCVLGRIPISVSPGNIVAVGWTPAGAKHS